MSKATFYHLQDMVQDPYSLVIDDFDYANPKSEKVILLMQGEDVILTLDHSSAHEMARALVDLAERMRRT